MTEQNVREVATRVVEEISSQYPKLPKPAYKDSSLLVPWGVAAAFIAALPHNLIVVRPHLARFMDEEELRFSTAHELGHWHQYHTIGEQAFIRECYRPSKRYTPEEYRQIPAERYADRFAFDYIGKEIDVVAMLRRVEIIP